MISERAKIEIKVLDKLRELEGTCWREVNSELQEDYNECCLWVLLYEDSDPRASHRAFCAIVEPYMEMMKPIQFTVAYTVLTHILDVTVDTLMSNEEILEAVDDPSFAKTTITGPRETIPGFKANLSGTRPTE